MNGKTILAVVVAAVVYFVIGAIWYGQFSVAWLAGIGRTMAELAGARPDDLYPPDQHRQFLAHLERTRDEKQIQRVLLEVPDPKGETSSTWSTTYVPVIGADGEVKAILGIGDDVTEAALAERSVERLSRIYHTLSDTNEAIVRATTEDELFQRVCEITLGLGGLRSVAVLLHDAANERLVHKAIAGPAADTKRAHATIAVPSIPAGAFPVVDALHQGAVVVRNRFDLDEALRAGGGPL